MRVLKKILKVTGAVLLVLVALTAFLLWWTYAKRPVAGAFVREAGPGTFKFTDIPRGRVLNGEEVDGYARKLLGEMTLQQKVLQMSGDSSLWDLIQLITVEQWKYNDHPIPAGADRRLAIPPIAFSDGPRGVVLNHSTAFPVAMARGATWDRDLQRRFGDVVGKEIRAQGGNLWGGVCVNLLRHPSWGRAQETLGEDPYLLAELSVPSVEAVQAHNVMACAKHYALNSIEETRTKVDVRVDERTLREVYLPQFRRLAERDVASFMSAYNRVNGDYCGESRHLLREILEEEWGYRGFVMSDFFSGVYDGKKAALAGLDLEMPWTVAYGKKLLTALEEGEVPLAVVDEAVLRLLRRKIEYATRPDPIAYPASLVRAPEHAALAREVAEKGTVLLRNEGGLLPLDEAALGSVAVLGRLADAPNLGDYGSSRVYPPETISVVRGLREALGAARVVHEKGADLPRARAAARAASVVVVVAGFDGSDEGEYIPDKPDRTEWGGDREDLSLKAVDRDLILAAAAENPRTIVVLIGGSAIAVEEWQEKAGAILMAFYPGEQGGAALARLLLGRVNPSGKLPFTVPRDASLLPPFDNASPSVEYGYYHGYTLAEKKGWEPRYAFGQGLAYTTYAYAHLALDSTEAKADGIVRASVDVANTGARAGEEVVELYVGFPASKVDRPRKLLRGFERVGLAPGETKRVTIPVAVKDLAYYDVGQKAWVVERTSYTVSVGTSSRQADLLSVPFRVSD
jgi:beta-glucosidase